MEADRGGEFSKEVDHWFKADLDRNEILNSTEFLAFIHPEHNKFTLRKMAIEMMPSFDRNGDKVTFQYLPSLSLVCKCCQSPKSTF